MKISVKNLNDFMTHYETFYGKIFNYIFRNVRNKETAEDLTSGTFLKALNFIKTKNTVIENFSAWIYKIATNELYTRHKKYGSKNIVSIDKEGMSLLDFLADKRSNFADKYNDFITIKEAMKQLPNDDMIILELHFFERQVYAELSEILDMKESTIRSKVHRAVKKLKAIIEK